jgi:hypothetical protein
MSQNKIQRAKQALLGEITSTFSRIAYLKAQADGQINNAIKAEELRQRLLLFKLSLLEA